MNKTDKPIRFNGTPQEVMDARAIQRILPLYTNLFRDESGGLILHDGADGEAFRHCIAINKDLFPSIRMHREIPISFISGGEA